VKTFTCFCINGDYFCVDISAVIGVKIFAQLLTLPLVLTEKRLENDRLTKSSSGGSVWSARRCWGLGVFGQALFIFA
jgi:hypothetical protein